MLEALLLGRAEGSRQGARQVVTPTYGEQAEARPAPQRGCEPRLWRGGGGGGSLALLHDPTAGGWRLAVLCSEDLGFLPVNWGHKCWPWAGLKSW